ncbi:MAG: prephenate dehydrogenase [Desulfovibrionaceae bacterium]|nr:prephenate dehydrogenase [Desulfovibrionaceae bacterium]
MSTPLTVAVVGSHGRMGGMLMRRLAGPGRSLHGVDLPLTPDVVRAAVADADVVLFCVPAAAMRDVVALCVPHLRPGTVLADIVSVKAQPLAVMESLWDGPCVGTHPLFGPAPAPDLELRVCITPGSRAAEAHVALVESLFTGMGARCFRASAEEHDRAVGLIQGMNFITSLAYFAMLADHDELTPFITPSFLRRQEASRKLLTEDGALFTWLFEANPYAHESVRRYRQLLNVAAGGDIELLLGRARRWLEKH